MLTECEQQYFYCLVNDKFKCKDFIYFYAIILYFENSFQ
jgi:hypothetical protein